MRGFVELTGEREESTAIPISSLFWTKWQTTMVPPSLSFFSFL